RLSASVRRSKGVRWSRREFYRIYPLSSRLRHVETLELLRYRRGNRMTRILAFDISASPGVAVIEVKTARKPFLIHADSIKTDTKSSDAQRFAYVEAFAIKAIHEHGPFDYIVREHFTKGGSK